MIARTEELFFAEKSAESRSCAAFRWKCGSGGDRLGIFLVMGCTAFFGMTRFWYTERERERGRGRFSRNEKANFSGKKAYEVLWIGGKWYSLYD